MRLAVYAGTFDPLTRGHLTVIERAAKLFDRLLVVLAVNPMKHPLFGVEERQEMIREAIAEWPTVSCAATEGYVARFAREKGATFLVRGVRGATDADDEIALAHANLALAPEIETVFVPAHPGLSEVSSSRLKELAREGADLAQWCTPGVARRLAAKLATMRPPEARHVEA